jgi:hypothetical protein
MYFAHGSMPSARNVAHSTIILCLLVSFSRASFDASFPEHFACSSCMSKIHFAHHFTTFIARQHLFNPRRTDFTMSE